MFAYAIADFELKINGFIQIYSEPQSLKRKFILEPII